MHCIACSMLPTWPLSTHQPHNTNNPTPTPPQLVRSLTTCRVLVVPRAAYVAIAADFTQSARTVLENLQKQAEQLVQQEFRGGMASRLLRSSLAAAGAYGGLAYQNTSAEAGGAAKPPVAPGDGGTDGGGGGGAGGPPSKGLGLSLRQQQVVGTLQRVRALVRHHVAGVSGLLLALVWVVVVVGAL